MTMPSNVLIALVLAVAMHATSNGSAAQETNGATMAGHESCDVEVPLSDEAERQPGGALYDGPMPKGTMAEMKAMSEMKGSHADHGARRGGELMMARNKLRHVEVVYSKACGYRVFLYNAFTNPIDVRHCHAFVIIVPNEDSDLAEMTRFLMPTDDGGYLQARLDIGDSQLAETELYIKFPEHDEPEMFTAFIGAHAH